jgi:hypothetical protein
MKQCPSFALSQGAGTSHLGNGSVTAKSRYADVDVERSERPLPAPIAGQLTSDTNGPLLPFTSTSGCCGAARRTGLSCILQYFFWLKRRSADKADLENFG